MWFVSDRQTSPVSVTLHQICPVRIIFSKMGWLWGHIAAGQLYKKNDLVIGFCGGQDVTELERLSVRKWNCWIPAGLWGCRNNLSLTRKHLHHHHSSKSFSSWIHLHWLRASANGLTWNVNSWPHSGSISTFSLSSHGLAAVRFQNSPPERCSSCTMMRAVVWSKTLGPGLYTDSESALTASF